jgi:hypothetical protein
METKRPTNDFDLLKIVTAFFSHRRENLKSYIGFSN